MDKARSDGWSLVTRGSISDDLIIFEGVIGGELGLEVMAIVYPQDMPIVLTPPLLLE